MGRSTSPLPRLSPFVHVGTVPFAPRTKLGPGQDIAASSSMPPLSTSGNQIRENPGLETLLIFLTRQSPATGFLCGWSVREPTCLTKPGCTLDTRRTVLCVTGLGRTCVPQGYDGPAPSGGGASSHPQVLLGRLSPQAWLPQAPVTPAWPRPRPQLAAHTWSSIAALKTAPSTGRSTGERGRLERSRNFAARPPVPAWASLSTMERGRSLATAGQASGSGRRCGSQVSGCPGGDGWCWRVQAATAERDRETASQGER